MLRKVALNEVRLGMFVHAMEGSWLRHPFWRRRFLLDNEHDLKHLLDSDIHAVVIDDERGAPLELPQPAARPATTTPSKAFKRPPPQEYWRVPPSVSNAPCSVAEEAERARTIVSKSKRAVMKMFGEARMRRTVEMSGVAPLVEEISASVVRNASALIGIVRLKNKNEYNYMHSVAVRALMINLARTLELDDDLVREIGLAGLLHDIGKMAVPNLVLDKPGRLTDDEFAVVREHSQRGYDLIVGSLDAPAIAADVVLHHHEKFDGSSYPTG